VVVQSTEHSSLADGTASSVWFTRLRDLLLDPLMRPLGVVEGDVLLQDPPDLTPASQQKIVQGCASSKLHPRTE
jgi:hypothetical protein